MTKQDMALHKVNKNALFSQSHKQKEEYLLKVGREWMTACLRQ